MKAGAKELDQRLLDVWYKYWRLAFIKEPFEVECSGVRHVMTPYRVYDCFVNGELFHSNDATHNVILLGSATLSEVKQSSLFLRNVFHSIVVNLCFAAIGLKRFIDNGRTFADFPISGNQPVTTDFIRHRKKVDQLDDQYRVFSDWVRDNGGLGRCYWGG